MVFIIAEAGVNHNGEAKQALRLIDAAKEAGADACKFQMFDAERLEPESERRDMLKALQFDISTMSIFLTYARQHEIEFICTPFDVDSLKALVNIGVRKIKIGSADLRNRELLSAAAKSGKELILSTGMSTIGEISRALLVTKREHVALLHCTSAYPTPLEDVNLKAMETLRDMFKVPVGLSDHSEGITVPIAAAAMGAIIVEKHLTLDRHQQGPDHLSSIGPNEFKTMVEAIRDVEIALGDGNKRPMPSEKAVIQVREEREDFRLCASS